jgi:hypothetical protein
VGFVILEIVGLMLAELMLLMVVVRMEPLLTMLLDLLFAWNVKQIRR